MYSEKIEVMYPIIKTAAGDRNGARCIWCYFKSIDYRMYILESITFVIYLPLTDLS
jgi:hypothetical protein